MSIKQELLNIRKRNLDKIGLACPICNHYFEISLLSVYTLNGVDCPFCGLHLTYEKSRPF